MTFETFFNLFNETRVDFDGYYGTQCVDLVKFWSRAIGGPPIKGNAKTLLTQGGDFYAVILNQPMNIPKKGDIVVWGSGMGGGFGHTAIAAAGCNVMKLIAFGQNYPTYSHCKISVHNYKNVLGWLHPIN